MKWLAVVLVLVVPQPQDADKAAAELLQKLEDKVMKAKTLHVVFEAAPEAEGRDEKLKGEIKIGGNGAFVFKVTVNEGRGQPEEVTMRSDGKAVTVAGGPPSKVDTSKWKPEIVQKCLRRASMEANFLGIVLMFGRSSSPESVFEQFIPKEIKSEGKEKVDGVDASIVSFKLELEEGPGRGAMELKLWVDPAKLTVLKRAIKFGPENIVETTSRFEVDAAFPADAFEFQTAAMLKEGLALQAARSVTLFARYTGRLPKSLDELSRRPEDLPASHFWPTGGFWIGGPLPKDLEYSKDATQFTVGSIKEPIPPATPIAAPTERLKKIFEARVRLQLLRAAAEGYHKASLTLPAQADDLHRKPDSVKYWPEGGWIRSNLSPSDPWGETYEIKGGTGFSAAVKNRKARQVRASELTPEERKALEDASLPLLSAKDTAEVEALIAKLGSERLTDREEALKAIVAKGKGALRLVNARLAVEKDPEIVSRLGVIRDTLASGKPSWEAELKSLTVGFAPAQGGMSVRSNERNGSVALKVLTTAQADFRANDRDGNGVNDFWVRDVAGLYGLESAPAAGGEAAPGAEDSGKMIKLIEPKMAASDATEGRWEYPALKAPEPEARAGYYLAALKFYQEGEKKPYHKGNGRNEDMFGFVAYPAEYGVTGRMTFIVNEDNTIWKKDLEGEEVDTFPARPEAEGWQKLD